MTPRSLARLRRGEMRGRGCLSTWTKNSQNTCRSSHVHRFCVLMCDMCGMAVFTEGSSNQHNSLVIHTASQSIFTHFWTATLGPYELHEQINNSPISWINFSVYMTDYRPITATIQCPDWFLRDWMESTHEPSMCIDSVTLRQNVRAFFL